jgi:IS1 family transposase
MTYQGCLSRVVEMVKIMPVRGIGIRDISAVLKISITKVLKVLKSTKYQIKPKQTHYDRLEVDEFWTYVGKKKNKVWLIYAYHRGSGEIVAYVWGKRDLKTAKKPGKRLRRLGISYDRVATDDWDSFVSAFTEDNHDTGKKHTAGIEGNNCRMRHWIRRAFRRMCCFSRKLRNHWKALSWHFFTSTMASFDNPSYFVDHLQKYEDDPQSMMGKILLILWDTMNYRIPALQGILLHSFLYNFVKTLIPCSIKITVSNLLLFEYIYHLVLPEGVMPWMVHRVIYPGYATALPSCGFSALLSQYIPKSRYREKEPRGILHTGRKRRFPFSFLLPGAVICHSLTSIAGASSRSFSSGPSKW